MARAQREGGEAASWAFRWPASGAEGTRYAKATATSAFVFFRRSPGMARNEANLMPFSQLFMSRRHFQLAWQQHRCDVSGASDSIIEPSSPISNIRHQEVLLRAHA